MNRAFLFIVLIIAGAAVQAGEPGSKDKGRRLFDGKSLAGWKSTNFGGEGEVEIEKGAIRLGMGTNMTGITYAGKDFPKINYEVVVEAKKVEGSDFFCTTTFPVSDGFCSLVVGGWGGAVVGLSSIDGKDASENETKILMGFKRDQWYTVRIRVTAERIAAWIDDKQVVDLPTKGRKIGIRPECDLCRPFGIATWSTVGLIRDIRVRSLKTAEK